MSVIGQNVLAALAALAALAWLMRRWILRKRSRAGCDRCAAAYSRTTKRSIPRADPHRVVAGRQVGLIEQSFQDPAAGIERPHPRESPIQEIGFGSERSVAVPHEEGDRVRGLVRRDQVGHPIAVHVADHGPVGSVTGEEVRLRAEGAVSQPGV